MQKPSIGLSTAHVWFTFRQGQASLAVFVEIETWGPISIAWYYHFLRYFLEVTPVTHQQNIYINIIYIYIKYIISEFMNLGLNPFIFPFLNG